MGARACFCVVGMKHFILLVLFLSCVQGCSNEKVALRSNVLSMVKAAVLSEESGIQHVFIGVVEITRKAVLLVNKAQPSVYASTGLMKQNLSSGEEYDEGLISRNIQFGERSHRGSADEQASKETGKYVLRCEEFEFKLNSVLTDTSFMVDESQGSAITSAHMLELVDIVIHLPFEFISKLEESGGLKKTKVKLDDIAGATFDGVLHSWNEKTSSNTQLYRTIITIRKPKEQDVFSGMPARIVFDVPQNSEHKEKYLTVPVESVFGIGQYEKTKGYVWVIGSNDFVEKRWVTVSRTDEQYAFVLNGLELGERIVIAGGEELEDGDLVLIWREGRKLELQNHRASITSDNA